MLKEPRIYIVDDEAPARARLADLLQDIVQEYKCPNLLVGEAANAQTALDEIVRLHPDIVLLDVQMPGTNGIELATHMSRLGDTTPAIIFVTAFDSYALTAFELHALDYLMKPIHPKRLAEAITRIASLRTSYESSMQLTQALAGQQNSAPASAALISNTLNDASKTAHIKREHFCVHERGRLLLVPVTEVIYLKAELKYTTLRTSAHEYVLEESLVSLEEELGDRFIRIHRNCLVARSAIVGVEKGNTLDDPDNDFEKGGESWQVVLRSVKERLPISRRQWPLVKALLNPPG